MAYQWGCWARREIELCGNPTTSTTNVVVVKQVLLLDVVATVHVVTPIGVRVGIMYRAEK